MVLGLLFLGLICVLIGMYACLEIPDDKIARVVTIVTITLGLLFVFGAIVTDSVLRANYHDKEWNDCKRAGGDHVIITAGDQPDICVNNKNVILPQGWQEDPW